MNTEKVKAIVLFVCACLASFLTLCIGALIFIPKVGWSHALLSSVIFPILGFLLGVYTAQMSAKFALYFAMLRTFAIVSSVVGLMFALRRDPVHVFGFCLSLVVYSIATQSGLVERFILERTKKKREKLSSHVSRCRVPGRGDSFWN